MADDHLPFAGINLKILKALSDWSEHLMKQPPHHQLIFYYKLKDSILSASIPYSITIKEIYNCFEGDDFEAIKYIFRHPRPSSTIPIVTQFNKKTILKILTLWVIVSSTIQSEGVESILREGPHIKTNTVLSCLWNTSYGMNDLMTNQVIEYIADDLRLITGRNAISHIADWAWPDELWDTGTFIAAKGMPSFKSDYDSEVERLFTSPQQFFMNWKGNPFLSKFK